MPSSTLSHFHALFGNTTYGLILDFSFENTVKCKCNYNINQLYRGQKLVVWIASAGLHHNIIMM